MRSVYTVAGRLVAIGGCLILAYAPKRQIITGINGGTDVLAPVAIAHILNRPRSSLHWGDRSESVALVQSIRVDAGSLEGTTGPLQ